jgi:hypothetical protein
MDKMETVRKIEVKKIKINDLSVCILFCALCSIAVSFASYRFHLYKSVLLYEETNCNKEALKLAQQTVDIDKPSHAGAIKNEMAKPDNGRVENGPAGDGGTDVIPFKTQQRQENSSENETLKGLLPP